MGLTCSRPLKGRQLVNISQQLLEGIKHANAGDWDAAHSIAQTHEGHTDADWLHAILHKIEGDAANSRYWYSKASKSYDTYSDARSELEALKATLQNR